MQGHFYMAPLEQVNRESVLYQLPDVIRNEMKGIVGLPARLQFLETKYQEQAGILHARKEELMKKHRQELLALEKEHESKPASILRYSRVHAEANPGQIEIDFATIAPNQEREYTGKLAQTIYNHCVCDVSPLRIIDSPDVEWESHSSWYRGDVRFSWEGLWPEAEERGSEERGFRRFTVKAERLGNFSPEYNATRDVVFRATVKRSV